MWLAFSLLKALSHRLYLSHARLQPARPGPIGPLSYGLAAPVIHRAHTRQAFNKREHIEGGAVRTRQAHQCLTHTHSQRLWRSALWPRRARRICLTADVFRSPSFRRSAPLYTISRPGCESRIRWSLYPQRMNSGSEWGAVPPLSLMGSASTSTTGGCPCGSPSPSTARAPPCRRRRSCGRARARAAPGHG